MVSNSIVKLLENGAIICPEKQIDAEKLPWVKHPEFEGVYLKNLITSADTAGTFSCHIVRISQGCSVAEHSHDKLWEFNEALQGSGTLILGGRTYVFKVGDSCVNPPGVPHSVSAPDGDLYITAKFMPALL